MSLLNLIIKIMKTKMILIKLILTFTGVSIISSVIIVFVFSHFINNESVVDISNANNLALSNVCTTFQNIIESTNRTAYEVYNNPFITDISISTKKDKIKLMTANNLFQSMITSNPNIYSICVVHQNSIILESGGNINFPENIKDLSDIYKNGNVLTPIPRELTNKRGEKVKLYTIIYHENIQNDDFNNVYVIVNIKALNIYDQVYTKFVNQNQDIIITNAYGTLLLNRSHDMSGRNISIEKYFRMTIGSKSDSGRFNIKYKNNNYIYNYIIFNGSKYKAFLVSDYNTYFEKLFFIRNVVLFTCILVILAIILLSLLVSYKLYNPINNVFSNVRNLIGGISKSSYNEMSEIKYISNAFSTFVQKLNSIEFNNQNNFIILKNNFIKNLIFNENEIPEVVLKQELLKHNIIISSSSEFLIIVCRIGHYKNFYSNNSFEAREFQLNSIESIVCDIMKEVLECSVCRLNEEHFIIFGGNKEYSNGLNDEIIIKLAVKAQSMVNQLLNHEITIGISNVFKNIGLLNVQTNYFEAYNLTNYRLMYGRLSVFKKSNLDITSKKANKSSYYIDSVLNSVKNSNFEGYKKYLEALFEEVKGCNYDLIVGTFYQLVDSIMRVPYNLQTSYSDDGRLTPEGILNTIKGFENYSELEKWFIDFYNQTTSIMSNIKVKKPHELIEDVKKYINENYTNSTLSASLVAEKLSVTPQYFSKIFNEYSGCSFPDYVNNTRLEKAKYLLTLDPYISIGKVCEKVGFNSNTYFSTAFTKKFGVPPSKYVQTNIE